MILPWDLLPDLLMDISGDVCDPLHHHVRVGGGVLVHHLVVGGGTQTGPHV